MNDRRIARRAGHLPIAACLLSACLVATCAVTGLGCATSASRDWAQTSPTMPPDARPADTVHLGAFGGSGSMADGSAEGAPGTPGVVAAAPVRR